LDAPSYTGLYSINALHCQIMSARNLISSLQVNNTLVPYTARLLPQQTNLLLPSTDEAQACSHLKTFSNDYPVFI